MENRSLHIHCLAVSLTAHCFTDCPFTHWGIHYIDTGWGTQHYFLTTHVPPTRKENHPDMFFVVIFFFYGYLKSLKKMLCLLIQRLDGDRIAKKFWSLNLFKDGLIFLIRFGFMISAKIYTAQVRKCSS